MEDSKLMEMEDMELDPEGASASFDSELNSTISSSNAKELDE